MGKDVDCLTSNVRNEDIIRHHVQESAWGVAQARKDQQLLCRLLERAVLFVNGGVFVEHVYKLFFQVLS